jgi:hypothetical protein
METITTILDGIGLELEALTSKTCRHNGRALGVSGWCIWPLSGAFVALSSFRWVCTRGGCIAPYRFSARAGVKLPIEIIKKPVAF